MTNCTDAMCDLNTAIYVALRNANTAAIAASNEDGAPFGAVRDIWHKLSEIAADVDCLIDHGCTRAEFADMKALHEGTKLAGMTGAEE